MMYFLQSLRLTLQSFGLALYDWWHILPWGIIANAIVGLAIACAFAWASASLVWVAGPQVFRTDTTYHALAARTWGILIVLIGLIILYAGISLGLQVAPESYQLILPKQVFQVIFIGIPVSFFLSVGLRPEAKPQTGRRARRSHVKLP